MTRNESADLMRMSVSTIANYERRGKLHPQHGYRKDGRGVERRVTVYDPQELLKLPHPATMREVARDPGEVAARCFELFDQDKTIREVVIALRETPERVRALYQSWGENSSSIVKTVGEFEAQCFELFDQGRAIREVVIALRETPERVHALRESWLDSGAANLTMVPAAKEAFEKLLGPFDTIADLLVLIETRLANQKAI